MKEQLLETVERGLMVKVDEMMTKIYQRMEKQLSKRAKNTLKSS